jgi:hypothetical protein
MAALSQNLKQNMSNEISTTAEISLPRAFHFDEVRALPRDTEAVAVTPDLGPLASFVGTWKGSGFNTIFRPDNPVTPTQLPNPVLPAGPVSDNILELNLTSESLAFSPSLGSVPNRGTNQQGDIFLNGVPYLQTVNDVTNPGQSIGIHVEPGLWMIVPPTTVPDVKQSTVFRMGSIPHGTTIEAQGIFITKSGAPTIEPVDITPFKIGTNPPAKIPFASQKVANPNTPRIPQDLTQFVNNGTITQDILNDPNSILRNIINQQEITSTTTIIVSTSPADPLFGVTAPGFGGGTDNIAFLEGDAAAANPNANGVLMRAIFWIETVKHTIFLPVLKPNDPPLILQPEIRIPGHPGISFSITPPNVITVPRTITFTTTQIQYSQLVILNFKGLSWPHVSVATLTPANPIPIAYPL